MPGVAVVGGSNTFPVVGGIDANGCDPLNSHPASGSMDHSSLVRVLSLASMHTNTEHKRPQNSSTDTSSFAL